MINLLFAHIDILVALLGALAVAIALRQIVHENDRARHADQLRRSAVVRSKTQLRSNEPANGCAQDSGRPRRGDKAGETWFSP